MAGASRQLGFTLIEILVVIVILGLLATVALFSLGSSSERRELEEKSRGLFLVFQVAAERSILDNRELGVQIANNRVRFLRYLPMDQTWEEFSEAPFGTREWDDRLVIEAETEDDPPRMPTKEANTERPDLVFFSSGETTPFRVTMSLAGDPERRYRIETDGLNPLRLLQPDEEDGVRLR